MLNKKLTYIVISLLLFININCIAFANNIPNPQEHFYYDEVGVLSENTKKEIEEINMKLEKLTGSQVIVAVVKDINGYGDIDSYASTFFEKWKIGDKDKDNGVLLVASISDKKIKLETGYGIEGAINDGKAGRILDDFVIPNFKKQDYDAGMKNGFIAIVKEIEKEYQINLESDNVTSSTENSVSIGSTIRIIIWILLLIFIFFPKGPRRRKSRGGFYPMGTFGGGFSSRSSGGFGGFSGGGGSSGGGGASRGW